MNELKLVVAAALVDSLENPTQLLAARRVKPAELAGRWEFPGGKVDPGETPEQALHRELKEELGITVRLGTEITGPDNGAWIITDRHAMRLWYAQLDSGTPEPLIEHDHLEWSTFENLGNYNWLDGDVRIVEHIMDRSEHAPLLHGAGR